MTYYVCIAMLLFSANSLFAQEWTWTNEDSSSASVYGLRGVPSVNNHPGKRMQATVWSPGNKVQYLFGGIAFDEDGKTMFMSDLWRYDSTSQCWTWLAGSDTKNQPGSYEERMKPSPSAFPSARLSGVAWSSGERYLYLFGGVGFDSEMGYGAMNDLWRFDISTGLWAWIAGEKTKNQDGRSGIRGEFGSAYAPCSRYGCAAWCYNDSLLLLFGGRGRGSSGRDQLMNDIWVFDIAQNMWKWVGGGMAASSKCIRSAKGEAAPGNVPGARCGASCWHLGDGDLYLTGGLGQDEAGNMRYLNDTWKYCIHSGQWAWLSGETVN